ncbi:type VI secretion system baseplate subunit TssG [Chitinivorax sp. B]|uniref:type VI secretion system baseplate subunit TssG n=1 Tax=Chitinivorax sp. B TaxID=2502235 RepID=UPI0010F80549|nr:type VI secretion system baseplate subunit TssG [Chitinivorax sp. B]
MQRRHYTPVINRLTGEPERFEFFQSVRLLTGLLARQQTLSSARVVGDLVRFKDSLRLTFPPSEVEKLDDLTRAGEEDVRRTSARYVLTPTFFGLTGPTGVLPRHYTEMLAEREQIYRDRAAKAFLDVFSSRMTTLFFRAWQKYRLPIRHEIEPRRGYLPELLRLAGIHFDSHDPDRQDLCSELSDEVFAEYAGVLRHQPVSAMNVARVLADYFDVVVQAEQFVGRWFELDETQVTRLGGDCATLGVSAFCGGRVWQRDQRIKLCIGPMTIDDFRCFLPNGRNMRAMTKLLKYWCGYTCEWEVKLILKKEEVKPVQISASGLGTMLGRDTFLVSKAAEQDMSEARYELVF